LTNDTFARAIGSRVRAPRPYVFAVNVIFAPSVGASATFAARIPRCSSITMDRIANANTSSNVQPSNEMSNVYERDAPSDHDTRAGRVRDTPSKLKTSFATRFSPLLLFRRVTIHPTPIPYRIHPRVSTPAGGGKTQRYATIVPPATHVGAYGHLCSIFEQHWRILSLYCPLIEILSLNSVSFVQSEG